MAKTKLKASEVQAVERSLYESSFYHFVIRAWPEIIPDEFQDNWHIRVLCDHLQAVAEGKILKLLINICPRSGKSVILNQLFPCWLWTHTPNKRILTLSHGQDLAIENSTNARRLIESDWYQALWPTALRRDQNSKSAFANDKKGARITSPIGSVTGKGANLVIVDDPHSVEDAKSEQVLKHGVDLFREAVSSRVNNPKKDAIIVVMQRLHQKDVSGYILDHPELDYDHLCIPYVADGEERKPTKLGWVDHRQEGELMIPDRFDEAFVIAQKTNLTPYGFAGQYQQNPVPAEDGFFDLGWFKRFDLEQRPKTLNYYMTSDHAPSGKHDYNVFRVWGVDPQRNIYLVDSFRKKCTMDVAFGMLRGSDGRAVVASEGALALIRKWRVSAWFPEKDAAWNANANLLQAYMLEVGVFCYIKPVAPQRAGDKRGKAQPLQAMASNGAVHIPTGLMGDDTLAEYASFPVGKHDDQVDADGLIARMINETVGLVIAPTPEPRKRDDWGEDTGRSASDLCWG